MRNLHDINKKEEKVFEWLTEKWDYGKWDYDKWAFSGFKTVEIYYGSRQIRTASVTCSVCWQTIAGLLPDGKTRLSVTHTGSAQDRSLLSHRIFYQ